MAKPIDAPRRLAGGSLGQRFFLLTAALLILSVAAAVMVARVLVGASVANRDVQESLQRSTEVQRDLVGDRLEQLYLRALTVSGDPNFVAYLTAAIDDNDPASLIDQLDERQRDLGFDFAVVLDVDGKVIARTDLLERSGDFTTEAPWRAAMEGDYSADGLWARDDGLYYAVLVPLATAGTLQGYLVAAYTLGDEAAAELRQILGSEVVWVLDHDGSSTLAASTLDESGGEDLLAWLAGDPVADGTAQPVTLDGRRFLATVEPVSDLAGDAIGRVVNLGSLEEALAPYRRIGNILTGVGAAAVLLALIGSWLLPRRLFEPIQRLAAAAEAAAGGELDRSISGLERGDEVGRLARSFDHLLSSLREERDMQVYLTELTRTMPESEGGVRVPEARATERRDATLVGIELRGLGRRSAEANSGREALDQMASEARRIQQAVLVRNGELEQTSGHRLIAIFEGPNHSSRGLAAAAEVAARLDNPPAVALNSGTVVTGPATWHGRPSHAISGPAVDGLEDLLRAALPGTLLAGRSTYEGVGDVLAEAGVAMQEHRVRWSDQPIYALAANEAEPLAGSDVAATQNLSTAMASPRTASGSTALLQTSPDMGRMTLASVAPGRVLGGRFEILSELGAGGMGVVYRARDRELDEHVALKMLKHDAFDGDAKALEGLKDELRLARRISHPNVLRTYDFGEADGFPFISMEFVRGVTLKRLLDQSGRLPLSPGLRLARQLCRGLQAAHEQSVLHRDIKPENILLEHTGNLKLMDFGIAQPISRRPPSAHATNDQVVGTPFYLAPEQLEGMDADVRADIYACGVVFYELFTGRLPYPGGNLMQIMQRKLKEDPPPPSTVWPEMPKPLEAIIMRCLERNRDDRFPNVDALFDAFDVLRA